MSDTATKPPKTRKPNVGSDPTKGSRARLWQLGFYGFAASLSGVLIVVTLLRILDGQFPRIMIFVTVLVVGLSWGLVMGKRHVFDDPEGVRLGEQEADLRAFVTEVAEHVGAPIPDAIHVVSPAEFGVLESTRYLGRKVEKSVVTVGLPYLQVLTRQELAALLAREFAEFAPVGVVGGVDSLRSLRAARDLIAVERQGFTNGVYGSYARKMFRSIGGVGLAQVEAAERIAARTYGTDALRSAIEKQVEIVPAFDQLLREYVVPALQNQMHPTELYAGFEAIYDSPTRRSERADDVERRNNKGRNEFDLDLRVEERLERLDSWTSAPASVVVDSPDTPAHTLLDPEARTSEIAVGLWARTLMTDRTQPTSWQELTDRIYSVKTQSLASMVFDDEMPPEEQLDQAFEWSEADDWARVDGPMEACMKKVKEQQLRRTKWARCVVVEAAAATGAYSWQHNWDGPPILVDGQGRSLDAAAIAGLIAEGEAAEARSAYQAATSD